MNTAELDSYSLDDAVKFNQDLNPRLWHKQRMRPDVRAKLLEIAADFKQSLGLTDLEVKDITVSGSNAGFTYTPHSDIDLHLVVDIPQADVSDVYRELFDAKKYQYNAEHNITIGGYDVELYVENANQTPVSQGVYSLVQDDWINIPKRRRSTIDDDAVRSKYADIKHRIQSALDSRDHEQISAMAAKIKKMRTAGLASSGEMGPENLAYKMLRSQGWIKKLYDAKTAARDLELSLNERRKKKKRVRYGYGGYWMPGFSFGDSEGGGDGGGGGESVQEVSITPDGVNPSTKMFLEQDSAQDIDVLKSFAQYVGRELGIKRMPKIIVKRRPDWAEQNGSFGQYAPELNQLTLSLHGRHIVDVLRTLAHELTHAHQQQTTGIPDDGGETGSDFENEANARAGEFMRHFADAHPEYFDSKTLGESSGYIPTAAEKNDPRYVMALSPDVRPGATGKNANKMALKTDAQGRPGLLMKTANLREGKIKLSNDPNWYGAEVGDYKATGPVVNILASQLVGFEPDDKMNQPKSKANVEKIVAGLKNGDKLPPLLVRKYKNGYQVLDGHHRFWAYKLLGAKSIPVQVVPAKDIEELKEGRMPQPSQGPGKYRELNQPLGPETPPTMPAGTLRIDVSDMYDWYKIGQHISNMKGLGKHDFGAGPPSSIISFGDEETEHKFIKDLEATGLDITDIDPKDPKQPAGMRKIKTDPTYNVDEDIVESLRREFALLEDEYISEVKMSTANLRQLAAQTGALAGMEFEMIVPNIETDVEPEYEPDYDQDQRSRSFGDVRDFFHDGDYNSRRDADRLIEELDGEYQEWKQDQTAEAWERDGADYTRDYVANNDLFDRDEAMAQARDEIIDANPDLPQESEEFTELLSARLNEMETEFADSEFEARGNIHDAAFAEFSEMQDEEYDERSFLDDKYPYMTDIQNNFDISWPYYYDINDGQDGELDIDQVADDFSNSIGKPVNASRSYHGARREAGHYVVEPDGSLEGDNPGDGGLEFVSPPMPIDEMMSDLNKVKAWAKREGCYTNDSTGLHINISVPDYSLDKLDYVKLALLMGDEYVLELFGRSGNTYAKAATGKIRDALRKNPDLAPVMMDKMRDHMEDLATKAIHSGTTDKYTSINTKSGYIEFRSPGGDWLDANFDKIENTLLRFTVALSAAIDPQAYRQEYLKKLYKLLEGAQEKGGVDVVQLFSNYSAGELDKAALIRQVREKQLARNLAKGRTPPGQKFWWKVTNPANSMASIEVVAAGKEEAIAKAVEPNNYPEWARVQNTLRATPLRPYQEPQAPNQTGNWGIWMQSANRFARAPGQIDNSVLRRFPSRQAAEQWIAQTRSTNSALRTDIEVREIEPSVQNTGSTTSGNWGVWVPSLDRYATIGNAGPRRFEDQAGAEAWIQDYNQRHTGNDLELQPREIEPQGQFQSPENVPREGQPRNLVPTGPGPWEIYRISDNSSVRELSNTSRPEAEQEARNALGLRGEAPELYGVRTRQTTAQAPRTLTVPGQPQQQFTGEWKIVGPDGREIHRFGGIGNAQADANRVAIQWLQRNPRHMQDGVEVLPVMG